MLHSHSDWHLVSEQKCMYSDAGVQNVVQYKFM